MWLEQFYPELRRIESARRRALVQSAIASVIPLHPVGSTFFGVLFVGAAIGLAVLVGNRLSGLDALGAAIVAITLLAIGMLVATELSFMPLRRAIWHALDHRGVAICRACGQDLTGVLEPRCSECGAAVVHRDTTSGRIRSVAEIVVNARDLDAMRAFYVDVIGFPEHDAIPSDDPTIVFLRIGPLSTPLGRSHPQQLVLIDPVRHRPAAGRFDEIEQRRSALHHLAFEIDERDFERERRRLAALGLAPVVVPFQHVAARSIFLRDPDGNGLELICRDSTVDDSTRADARERIDVELRPAPKANGEEPARDDAHA